VWAAIDVPSSNVRVSVIAARADLEIIDRSFRQRSNLFIVRAEYLGSGPHAVNAGIVGGTGTLHEPYLGSYFQTQLSERWTVGIEASVSQDYARVSPFGAASGRPHADVLANARYAIGSGEVAAEFVWNGFAIDPSQYGAIPALYSTLLAGSADVAPFHPLFEREYYVLLARIPRFLTPRTTVVSSLTHGRPSNGSAWYVDISHATDRFKVFASVGRAFGPDLSTLRYPFSQIYRVGVTHSF
jgi:hypothetical protein